MRSSLFLVAWVAASLFVDGVRAEELGKSGKVEGAGKLAGIAQQRALGLSAATARDLADALRPRLVDQCTSLLITDDPTATTRLQQARSMAGKFADFGRQLDDLEEALAQAGNNRMGMLENKSLVSSVAGLKSQLGAVVELWKLFQSDYKVESFGTSNNPDWVAASLLRAYGACPAEGARNNCAFASRFPSLTDVDRIGVRLQSLVDRANDLQGDAKKLLGKSKKAEDKAALAEIAELVEGLKKFQAAALEPNKDGVAPITVLAPWLRAVDDRSCLARVIDSAPEGIVLTRETIFGSGGKVFITTAVQLAAIVSTSDGAPLAMACRQRNLAATLRLSRLAKDKPDPDAMPWADGASTVSRDCAPNAP